MAEPSAKNAGTIKLGDLTVNRLGLGTNRVSDNDTSRAVLKRALELDVNFIDTAQLYGQSQRVIGETLAPYPPGVIVSTKGGYETNDPGTLRQGVDESLSLLKLEQLPFWFLHRVHVDHPLEQTMNLLKDLRQAGKIGNLGLSEVSVEQIERARSVVPVAAVQNRYNLYERQHDDVLDYCTRENIVFVPFFPLASGRMAQDAKLKDIASKYNASSTQIALAWLLRRSPVMLPIPGTLSVEHLESNLAATQIDLSDQDYTSLHNF